MSALRFFSSASDGSTILVCKHPAGCLTWHWSISITHKTIVDRRWWLVCRSTRRTHQWHDYYRLPFGWTLIVSRQDYHRRQA